MSHTAPDAGELALLEDAVTDMFTRERAAEADPAKMWETIEGLELTLAGVADQGGGIAQAAALTRLAGQFAAPGPIAETAMLAAPLLSQAGLEIPQGPLTVAADETLTLSDGRLSGTARRVPWGRMAGHVVVIAGETIACVSRDQAQLSEAVNLAGEPRDDLTFDGAEAQIASAPLDRAQLRRGGALARAVAMAGALDRVLELSVRYAGEREQFGRPLGRFQVIQQDIAVLAGEALAARAAADAAVEAPNPLSIAAAKLRTGQAAGKAAAIAHQIHGAIGFTDEHELHRYTLRLWSWRDEFGSEQEWAVELGRAAASAGADGLWGLLVDR